VRQSNAVHPLSIKSPRGIQMKKIVLSVLLALGMTSAYADGLYLSALYGASSGNQSTQAIQFNLGYQQAIGDNFFLNTSALFNYYPGEFKQAYVPWYANSAYFKFDNAQSIAWMVGVGYNITKNLSINTNIGIGSTMQNYTSWQTFINQDGQEISSGDKYNFVELANPFLSVIAKYSFSSHIAVVAEYQYTIQASSINQPNIEDLSPNFNSITLPAVGSNALMAGLQFTF
jgi:hypothetical protein